MKKVTPEWSWLAICPECTEPVDEFDENVQEDGDDFVVTCAECMSKFIVSMR